MATMIPVTSRLRPLYVVESRRPTDRGWSDWRTDEIGVNRPRTRTESELDCAELPRLGPDWAEAEYRVRQVEDES